MPSSQSVEIPRSQMGSRERLQLELEEWLRSMPQRWTAPYGILLSQDPGGRFRSVTFGMARTMDATVKIVHSRFLLLKSSRHGTVRFDSLESLQKFLLGDHS